MIDLYKIYYCYETKSNKCVGTQLLSVVFDLCNSEDKNLKPNHKQTCEQVNYRIVGMVQAYNKLFQLNSGHELEIIYCINA